MLYDLPPELILYICTSSNISFADLYALRRCNRRLDDVIATSEEAVLHSICKQNGLVATSSGSSTAVSSVVPTSQEQRDSAAELQQACGAQQSLFGVYDRVQTWREFARLRHTVDKNWQEGRCVARWVQCPDAAGLTGVFRFKLDTETRTILYTSPDGLCTAITMDGKPTQQIDLGTNFCHIEYSNGFLVSHGSSFTAWQRDDLTAPPRLSELEQQALASSTTLKSENGPHWSPFATLASPGRASASKLRFPYHLSASASRFQLERIHLETGTSQSCDITSLRIANVLSPTFDPRINYIELLGDVALVAGAFSITAWNFKKGLVTQWPPVAPDELGKGHCRPRDLLEYDAPIWSAIHHDCKADSACGNLVATSRSASGSAGVLMYTPNSKLVSEGATYGDFVRQTVVLQTDAMITQLAVENGRACFILETADSLHSLWLINLVAFESLEEFKAKAPKPICLAYPLPSIAAPHRLEMTASEVIISGNKVLQITDPHARRMFGDDRGVPHLLEWESLTGEQLSEPYDYGVHLLTEHTSIWDRVVHEATQSSHFIDCGDSFVVYQFGEEMGVSLSTHNKQE